MRPFLLGSALSLALLAILELLAPWEQPQGCVPTPAQHAAAVDAGWIPGTDGYYRAIFGPDAY